MTLFQPTIQNIPSTVLHEKYIVPPFSVFNTHQTYWKEREKMWLDMGIGGTNGRITSNNGLTYDNRRMDKYAGKGTFNGTSAFSPTLTEIIYKWFTIPESNIFDPFAGGITRGVIASILGHHYYGCDINTEQVNSNEEEYDKLCDKFRITGSCHWMNIPSQHYPFEDTYDLVFTCPPYYNLERYTNLTEDLSNIPTYSEFLKTYYDIISMCYDILADDSFMIYVVSDIRDKKTTEYLGLVADTVKCCQEVGLKFYNEIILYNDTGNLAIVSGDYLDRARKVGRQHQNVLVFYKGNIKNIKEKFGTIA